MGRSDGLFLHQEVLLLALRREEGTNASAVLAFALGGALLAELTLRGRVTIEPTKKQLVNVTGAEPVGDELLDEALRKIRTAGRRGSAQSWVMRLAKLRNLMHRTAAGLCRRGVLRADEDTVLLLFRRRIYPESDPRPEREIVRRLESAIFTGTDEVTPRTVMLVSIAQVAGLLKLVLDRDRLKTRKARIEALVRGEVAGKAASAAAAQASAAAVMAVMAGVTASAAAARR